MQYNNIFTTHSKINGVIPEGAVFVMLSGTTLRHMAGYWRDENEYYIFQCGPKNWPLITEATQEEPGILLLGTVMWD